MDLPQAVSANAIQPSPTALASGGGSGGAVGVSNPPTPASLAVPVAATIPGWIIPTLVAGDLVVVLSAILWAAWGRGMGRWPWIAALFAVGCTQAIAALFLARSGTSQGPGPFSGRPPPLLDRLQEFASALLKSSPKAAAVIGVDSQIRASGRPIAHEAQKPRLRTRFPFRVSSWCWSATAV